METFGHILFGLLFLWAGYGHIKNHSQLKGYAASAFGNCPLAPQLSYLGGWPTGLYLTAVGILTVAGVAVGFYGAAAFLAVATVLYHRNLKDPGTWKNVSLVGAALALAVTV